MQHEFSRSGFGCDKLTRKIIIVEFEPLNLNSFAIAVPLPIDTLT